MKIAGKKLSTLHEEILVLPRSGMDAEGNEISDIVFKFHPVKDMDHFGKVYPEPTPTSFVTLPGEKVGKPDYSDPAYKKAVIERNAKLPIYITLASILATPGLEFETVDVDNPSTWGNFNKELAESGITNVEIGHIYNAALRVNSLDDTAMEEAKKRFLASQRRLRAIPSSPTDEQSST